MPIIPYHHIAHMDQTKKLKRREVKVGIHAFVLGQELHAYFCMADDETYQLFVRLLMAVINVKQGLQQLSDGSVVLNAAKNMM